MRDPDMSSDQSCSKVPSLQVVLDFAREDYHRQIARGESVVSRSATFLGLIAVFIGLVATVNFSGWAWRLLSVAGVALLAVSVVAFVYVVALHWYMERLQPKA
jgi:hypothetical protein